MRKDTSGKQFNPFLDKLVKETLPKKVPTLEELDPVVCKCGNCVFDRYFKMFKMVLN